MIGAELYHMSEQVEKLEAEIAELKKENGTLRRGQEVLLDRIEDAAVAEAGETILIEAHSGYEVSVIKAWADAANETLDQNVLVVVGDRVDVRILSEEAMRQCGWVRAEDG